MERYSKMNKYSGNNLLGVPTVEDPRSFDRLEKALTGQKDADLLIMSNLDDETLLSFCLANRSANLLCKEESFWRNRFIKKYGIPSFPVTSWRRVYLKSVNYLSKEEIDYDVLYNIVKNKEYKDIDLIIFLDNFQKHENKLNDFSFLQGIKGAVEVNDIEMIKLLMGMRNFSEYSLNRLLEFAVEASNKDLIDFFIASGAKNLNMALYAAIKSKNLDIVKYITNKMFPPTTDWLNQYLRDSFKYGTLEISGYFLDLIKKNEEELNRHLQKMRRNARSRK